MNSEALARRLATIADDKKARDIVVLDLRGLVGYTDFLVICTGGTERQTKAIQEAAHLELKHNEGLLPSRVEGVAEGRWVLMDYLDCVLHVFTPETRDFYRLEMLWGEAPRLELDLEGAMPEGLRAPAQSSVQSRG